jgi:hypothetical protein
MPAKIIMTPCSGMEESGFGEEFLEGEGESEDNGLQKQARTLYFAYGCARVDRLEASI